MLWNEESRQLDINPSDVLGSFVVEGYNGRAIIMSLKESLIQQTEQAVDGLRKRRETVELELQIINSEEKEAREMLQFLKNGSQVLSGSRQKQITKAYALEVLDAMDNEFTTHEFAETLEVSNGSAANWGRRFMDEGILTRKVLGRGSQPSIWEKV